MNAMTDENLLTRKQVAALLGISDNTLRKLRNREQLPCVQIGRLVKFRETDVKRLIDRLASESVGAEHGARLWPH